MTTQSRLRGFLILAVAHTAAVAAVILVWRALPGWEPIPRSAAADGAGMLVMFCFCFGFGNTSLFDAWWSLAPVALVWTWAVGWAPSITDPRVLIVCSLVSLYGLRLTANWAWGWRGLHHEDWRYLELQEKTGKGWWPTSFFGLHVYPTSIVFLCSWPAWLAISSEAAWSPWTTLAAVVTSIGILLETVSDLQLHRFRGVPENAGRTFQAGLWRWSRHPNYLGELLFWWGLLIFGLSTGEASPWLALAPLFLTIMLRSSSIPMMEERLMKTRTDYAPYRARTAALLPGLP